MIGDSLSDVKAGENAGCQSVLLASHVTGLSRNSPGPLVAENLESAVPLILNLCEPATRFIRTQPFELSRSSLREDS
jgi:beta-phosphoglucomutase-like phosphatase (HAD superfamily)